uniref:Circadian associated repressor of transcription n=1 Tax=Leptobrachium leishanense TaxID=445787 RepID=A0A8C5QEG4_9ANUR
MFSLLLLQAYTSAMEDTESSDFLSSCDSFYSAGSTAVSGAEDANYVDFNVFLSEDLEEATQARRDLDNRNLIPNSRLSSSDHPVLIRLENEYQARRNHWHQRSGQYFEYEQEIAARISCSSQTPLACRGATFSNRNGDEPLKHCVCQEEANHGAPHGLKRQRTPEAALPTEWWKNRQQQACPVSEGDRIFAQKCQELQGFIKPLTDLLNGLKKGRYERGLSSFQQSVAMDRIQRIIGVLQKPQMGERYLGTLLQVEMMLKIWFPSVTSSSSASSSDCEMEEPQYKMAKHPNVDHLDTRSCPVSEIHSPNGNPEEKLVPSPAMTHSHTDCVCCKDRTHVPAEGPSMNPTLMHNTPISNPSLGQVNSHHLNRAYGQVIFGPNTNNCGVILFLHNDPASSSPLPSFATTVQAEKRLPASRTHNGVDEDMQPTRSQSVPARLPASDRPGLRATASHSCSLSHILVCTQRPAGENT